MKSQKVSKNGKRVGKKSVIPTFLTKLYKILENEDHHSIIRWTENGKAFVVKNLTEFIDKVLPSYFKHNNFASFVRQLNMYDFHKTRNSNNENTFYHKMFTKGQRNSLKLIKRKIKNSSSNIDQLEYEDIKKENKNQSKKCLEDVYLNLIKNLDEISQKQKDIEEKVTELEDKNKDFVIENEKMTDDIIGKKSYIKNMEILILFIFELLNKKNDKSQSGFKLTKDKNLFSTIINCPSNIPFNNVSAEFEDTDKAEFLTQIIQNMNKNVLKLLAKKALTKYNLNIEKFNLGLLNNLNSDVINEKFPKTLQIENIYDMKHQNEFSDTIHSSPTSLLSTNDLIFNTKNMRSHILMVKRKRDDSSENEDRSGELNLNEKEKETMFDEVTELTPCLISSPHLSPTPSKIFHTDRSNIFNHSNKQNLDNCTNENLFGFCLVDDEYNNNQYKSNIGSRALQ